MLRLIIINLILLKVSATQLFNVSVNSEYDLAKVIFVSEPSNEIMFTTFHLETDFHLSNPRKAIKQHKDMQRVLRDFGVTVFNLKEVLLEGTESKNSKQFQDLVRLASHSIKYDASHLNKEIKKLASYKNITITQRLNLLNALKQIWPQTKIEYQEALRLKSLKEMSSETLVDIIMNRPIVELHLTHWFIKDRAFVILDSKILQNPLKMLYYSRDQQITTKKGIVILSTAPDRQGENEVTEFVFRKMGLNVIGKQTTGLAEGGDFIPVGDFAFFGQGLRTSVTAIQEIMKNDWFGYDEIAIVKDSVDYRVERLHLDTMFNILDGKGNVLVLEDVINNPDEHCYVDVYSKKVNSNNNKKEMYGLYIKTDENVEFGKFLKNRNFTITTITKEEQQNFAPNFLNLGNNTILTSYCDEKHVKNLSEIGVNVICLDIPDLTEGGGGIHCMTQVIQRAPLM